MNSHDSDEGTPIHFGCLLLTVLAIVGAVVILFTLGWRWLWLVPAALVALGMGIIVEELFEMRWLAVTDEHVKRGVPPRCPECDHGLDVALGKARFKARCPICGHREKGELLPPPAS